jgi:hypothetical protein
MCLAKCVQMGIINYPDLVSQTGRVQVTHMKFSLPKYLAFFVSVTILAFFSLSPKEVSADYKCKVDSGTCVPCTPDPSDPFDITKCVIGAVCPIAGEPESQCGGVSVASCPDTDVELEGFTLLACAPAPTIPPPVSPAIQPIPRAPVPCDQVRDNEFHSLRPYQASVCNTDYQTGLYCGNSVYLTDTFTETKEGITTPSDPGTTLLSRNCVDHPEMGTVVCDFGLNRVKTFSIDLRQLELPIMGNTEDVRNYTNNDLPPDEAISDLQKINEYTSWYLNGVPNASEYGHIEPIDEFSDEDSPYPKNIRTQIDQSGPINKLLPFRIQQRERIQQIGNAIQSRANAATGINQRHNQIVGCTREKTQAITYLGINLGSKLVSIPIPCNTSFWDSIWSGPLKSARRLADWEDQLPPLEEDYTTGSFIQYWEAYQEWRAGKYVRQLLSHR